MSKLDSVSLDTLSDSDAVSLLFELAGQGEQPSEKLLQLDAVVYRRLMQAYDGDELPALQLSAA
ncbi:MAG: hypothetical protein ACYC42_08430 [Lysobacter sp.]